MIKKHYTDVKEEIVTKASSTKTTIRHLITEADGAPRYRTRIFEIQPGGQIGLHDHPEEHHIYFLEGNCILVEADGNETEAIPGDVLYVPPNELHGYKNEGSTAVKFLCVIPIL